MKNVNEKNLIIIGLIGVVAILAGVLLSSLTGVFNLENEITGGGNDIEDNENISYKIVDESSNEGVVFKQLYVNNKLVNFENETTNIEVKQLDDILIVETSLASKTLYAVSKDVSVIGVFTTRNNNFYKNTNIIPTKYTYRDTYRIEGNSIYIQTDKLSQDSKYALCNLLASKDDEVVLYEEKFEYLGNNKFSTPIVTKEITRRQYIQEHNINCN